MILKLKPSEFKHIPESSSYNHNYYIYEGSIGRMKLMMLYEICHEDYNYYEYYLQDGLEQIFLGCSGYSIDDESLNEIEIKFREMFT